MKIVIVNWCDCGERIEKLGYPLTYNGISTEVFEVGSWNDVCEIIKKFYDAGLNVMIKHSSQIDMHIFIDSQGFSIR